MTISWWEVGKRCREAREYCGFTQFEVAEALGLHRPAISMVEGGNRRLNAEELGKLSNLYRRTKEWLMGTDEPKTELPAVLADKVADLPTEDVDEVIRFVEFLRFKRTKG